jgi:hypothetical protein
VIEPAARGIFRLKGALVAIDPASPLATSIVFQYNPATVTRELQARTADMSGGGGARAEALRLSGAPIETIALEIEIDVTDQLEHRDPIATTMGIYPQLSALEMLIYPKSRLVIANQARAQLGMIELVGPQAPVTFFIWGVKRVVPVRISGMTIREEAYDTLLNPIRASVSLNLRVLSYTDLQYTDPGYGLFLAHQVAKEAMAIVGSVTGLANALGDTANLALQ